MTTITERTTEAELIRAKAWRNLAILKDGRAVWGADTFPTERAARDAAEDAVGIWKTWGTIWIVNLNEWVPFSLYQSHLQLPIGGEP